VIEPQALKTAAECEEHGERTYACVNCGQEVTRKACETWHMDQCDDCIVRWAYDKAIADADKVMNDGAHFVDDDVAPNQCRALARDDEETRLAVTDVVIETRTIDIACMECGAAVNQRCPDHPCRARRNAAAKITRDANRLVRAESGNK
jgi:ribosomal protein L37AE/L43A